MVDHLLRHFFFFSILRQAFAALAAKCDLQFGNCAAPVQTNMLQRTVEAGKVFGRTAAMIRIRLLLLLVLIATIIPRVSPGLGDSGNGTVSIQHRLYQSKQLLMDSEAQFLALSDSHQKLGGDGLIRSARRSHNREPKFISFTTKNDNIEVN